MSTLSDDDRDSDDDVLPGPSREETLDIDDVLVVQLGRIHLVEDRRTKPTESDDDLLRDVHNKMTAALAREPDDARRRRLRRALNPSNQIREQIYYLRRLPQYSRPAPSYQSLTPSLQTIVNASFDKDYRKDAILLGLVEVLAELLVLDVYTFGFACGSLQQDQLHRSIRKFIANALTNLTYEHPPSKRRLCFYSEFIPTVVRILMEARNLAQVYAGLIRNLSWLVDSPEQGVALSPCVRPLIRTAIDANRNGDLGCVRATLNALWNLSPHCNENKRIICDEQDSLKLLESLLSNDTTVESASGVLKYASQYLATTSSHLEERERLIDKLPELLRSSTFTVTCNALGTLANLVAKDPHLQVRLRNDIGAMRQLNALRDSVREDVRSGVKTVLSHLHQPTGFNPGYGKMSSSVGGTSFDGPARDAGRLLHLRHARASPGAVAQHQLFAPTMDQRASSLPRHFARGGFSSAHGSTHPSPGFAPPMHVTPGGFMPPPQQMPFAEPDLNNAPFPASDGENDDDGASAQCNRSNASRQSFNTDLPSADQSGFMSVLDTADCSRLSPVSPSDLPASPTHYTYMRMLEEQKEQEEAKQQENSLGLLTVNTGGELRMNSGSDSTAMMADEPTPTFGPAFSRKVEETRPASKSNSSPEGEYAVLETNDDILERSIESARPQLKRGRRSNDAKLPMQHIDLDNLIQNELPRPRHSPQRSPYHKQVTTESDRLLMDSIMSAMPSPGAHGAVSKNVNGVHKASVTSTGRQIHQGHQDDSDFHDDDCEEDELDADRYERLRSPSEMNGTTATSSFFLVKQASTESSDDSDTFGREFAFVDVDTTLPLDCLEDEMIVDCSLVSSPQSTATSKASSTKTVLSNIPKSGIRPPSRLPKPTMKPAPISPRPRPAIAPRPSPQTQAVVPPYNYKKPKESSPKPPSPTDVKLQKPPTSSTTPASKMLVTTV